MTDTTQQHIDKLHRTYHTPSSGLERLKSVCRLKKMGFPPASDPEKISQGLNQSNILNMFDFGTEKVTGLGDVFDEI